MRTIRIIAALLIAQLTMSMTQCEKVEDFADLIVTNNTNDTILYNLKGGEPDDTLLWNQNIYPTSADKENSWVLPKSSVNLRDQYLPVDYVLHLFLFDKSQIDSLPWDSIRDNYLILRRYDLTSDDLVDGGWSVSYP